MLLAFLAFGLMASAISVNKILLYSMKPELLVGIRMSIAGALLGFYLLLRPHERLGLKSLKKYIPQLLFIALFTTYFNSNLKAYALAHMASAKMAFFGMLDPFVTALYSFFFFKERLSVEKIIGILLACVGVIVLHSGSLSSTAAFWQLLSFSYPEFAAFWAIVLSRFGWLQAQQLLKQGFVNPLQLNSLIMLIGGCLSLITAFFRNQTAIISFQEISLSPVQNLLQEINGLEILAGLLTYTIIVGNIGGYMLYAHALKMHSALFISLASFSIPLSVAFLGWLFLGEHLSISFFIACAITFIGMIVFYKDERTTLSK